MARSCLFVCADQHWSWRTVIGDGEHDYVQQRGDAPWHRVENAICGIWHTSRDGYDYCDATQRMLPPPIEAMYRLGASKPAVLQALWRVPQ